jgi:hypothetical protein
VRGPLILQNIYLETPDVLKYKRFLLILSAAILPLYLSMFRYHIFGATLRVADLVCFFVICCTLLIFPKYFLKFIQLKYLPMWIIMAYILVQGFLLDNIANSIKETIQFLWVCVYLGVAATYAEWDSKSFYKWTLIFLAISVAYTILFHISQGQMARYKLANDGKYAFGLLSVLLLLRANELNDKKTYLLFIISLLPLGLSLERKGIFGVLLICALVVLSKFFKAKPQLKGIPISLGILSLAFLPFVVSNISEFIDNKIHESLFLDEQLALYTSNIHRESLLINSYQIIRDNVFFGVGADKIKEYMAFYYVDARLRGGAHNFYIDTLVKYGITGLSMLFVWGVILMRTNIVTKSFSSNLVFFHLYCLFVITFMADGQAVLIMFLFPFSNPYLFKANDNL